MVGGVLGARAADAADLEVGLWFELFAGVAAPATGKVVGRCMGALFVLLRMPMREGFFWFCSACC